TVPRLSSLRPLPILAEGLLLPDFCSGPTGLAGRSMRDYLSGALTFAVQMRASTRAEATALIRCDGRDGGTMAARDSVDSIRDLTKLRANVAALGERVAPPWWRTQFF